MVRDNGLTSQPIPRLIRRITVPASTGFFFYTMYNVVDTYFAGLISTMSLSALSLSFSVFFIIIATGTGIATGTTALIANALGAGDQQKAQLLGIQGISFGIIVSIVLTYGGIQVSPFLFSLLGASQNYLTISLKYMDIIFAGTIFFMLQYMLNAILNALGDTRSLRNFLIAGFLLNIILDPWFIFGGLWIPPLGISGIALATVIIQLIGCLYLGFRVFKAGMISLKVFLDILPKLEHFKEIGRQGLPASINMATVGVGIFVITYFVSKFGNEAVAAYGIGMRVEQIVLIPTIGLNTATLSIVAQNNGARLYDRVKETLSRSLRYGAILATLGTFCVFILSRYLMTFFSDDANVIDIGSVYLKIDALVFYAYVILFVNIAVLQGMKRPMYAIWIGLFRQILAPSILFYILTRILDFGLMSIWWGILIITWSSALFTLFYARTILKKVN